MRFIISYKGIEMTRHKTYHRACEKMQKLSKHFSNLKIEKVKVV